LIPREVLPEGVAQIGTSQRHVHGRLQEAQLLAGIEMVPVNRTA
jgi:hypothetical protein